MYVTALFFFFLEEKRRKLTAGCLNEDVAQHLRSAAKVAKGGSPGTGATPAGDLDEPRPEGSSSHVSHLSTLLRSARIFGSAARDPPVIKHGPKKDDSASVNAKNAKDVTKVVDASEKHGASRMQKNRLTFEGEFMPKRAKAKDKQRQRMNKMNKKTKRKGVGAAAGEQQEMKRTQGQHLAKRAPSEKDWSWVNGNEGEGDEEASDHFDMRMKKRL